MNILFVTAYRDIGRTKWRHRPRSNAAYSSAFSRLRQALKYPLVLYTNNETLNGLPVGLTDNMPIVNIDSTNPSFFNKYLEEETRIMNLPSFRKLIPRQKQNKPEFNYSKYTLVTHEKYAVVLDASRRFRQYNYIMWIDFGLIHPGMLYPMTIDMCKLPRDKMLVVNMDYIIDIDRQIDDEDGLKSPLIWNGTTDTWSSVFPTAAVCGGTFSIPATLVAKLVTAYEDYFIIHYL